MLFRNLLLALGIISVVAGFVLSATWITQLRNSPSGGSEAQTQQTAAQRQEGPALPKQAIAVLVAARALPIGTLIRSSDIRWKEAELEETRPGNLLRNQVSESDFLGALTRREFAEGEALTASELMKPGDRSFLSAVLTPGSRAMTISVDAPQSSSGLVLPGDRIDVILTQHLGDAIEPARRAVAETVIRNVRVIAVDQALRGQPKAIALPGLSEARLPRTLTLELDETQAEKLALASQLGAVQISVLALEGSSFGAIQRRRAPIWASDVSPALTQIARKPAQPATSGSSIENSIRRPPALSF